MLKLAATEGDATGHAHLPGLSRWFLLHKVAIENRQKAVAISETSFVKHEHRLKLEPLLPTLSSSNEAELMYSKIVKQAHLL